MSVVPFASLPDESRLWCFGASRAPGGRETARLLDRMAHFLEDWTAHRRELTAGFAWRDHRFLLVAVDESRASASGCSVDALTAELRELESELGLGLLDASPVWFRDAEGRVRSVSRDEFRELAARGRVGHETPVFDLAVTRLADLRSGRWELPAASSWHSRLIDREL